MNLQFEALTFPVEFANDRTIGEFLRCNLRGRGTIAAKTGICRCLCLKECCQLTGVDVFALESVQNVTYHGSHIRTP